MFLKSKFTYLFLANLFVLYWTPFFDKYDSFIAVYSIFVFSLIVLVFFQSIKKYEDDTLESLAKRMTTNGKDVFFISGLTLFDLLIFLLIVPDASVRSFEETGISILFYSFAFLFIPLLTLKFTVENYGLKFEKKFWNAYKSKINEGNEPSEQFATFIITRIQYRSSRQVSQHSQISENITKSNTDDDITLTAYPTTYEEDNKDNDLLTSGKNPLFDSEESLAEDDPVEVFVKELYEIFPSIEQFTKSKPINIRPELLLNIIIENTVKDPAIYQFFQKYRI